MVVHPDAELVDNGPTKAASPVVAAVPVAAPAVKEVVKDLKFGGLVLTGSIAGRLRSAGITKATPVQEAAMAKIRRGRCRVPIPSHGLCTSLQVVEGRPATALG